MSHGDRFLDSPKRHPAILTPHQAAVLCRAISDIDAFLFSDRYDF